MNGPIKVIHDPNTESPSVIKKLNLYKQDEANSIKSGIAPISAADKSDIST